MAVEQRPHSPQPLRYEDYFYEPSVGKSFTQAAALWSLTRTGPLAIPDPLDQQQIITACEYAVATQFGPESLTSHATTFIAPLLKRFPFVIFSEGNLHTQLAKITQYAKYVNLTLPEKSVVISPSKISQFPKVTERITQYAVNHEGKLPHIVIIEDKVVNIIRIATALTGAKTDFIPQEDQLNDPNFDFDTFVANCTRLFSQNNFLRNSLSAVYVPPDKATRDTIGSPATDIAAARIATLIETINNLQETGQNKPFTHVDNAKNLLDTLPENSFIISDYDGPIGSQRLTLATRDNAINKAFAQMVETIYQKKYGCSPRIFYEILKNQANTAFIGTSGSYTFNQLPKETITAIISKFVNPETGTIDVRIQIRSTGKVVHLNNINLEEFTQGYGLLAPHLSSPTNQETQK